MLVGLDKSLFSKILIAPSDWKFILYSYNETLNVCIHSFIHPLSIRLILNALLVLGMQKRIE